MNWFAKMIFDGGGKQNAPAAGRCRKYILTKVCRFIKKIIYPQLIINVIKRNFHRKIKCQQRS